MTKKQTYFVSGIGTEIGKTVASSILVKALEADYWKPIQSGDLHHTDSDKIQQWAAHSKLTIHPERYRLQTPASPHYSAAVDGVQIQVEDFQLPTTDNSLIVEGAGGLLVPINEQQTILDVIQHLNIPVILVANFYLGSINHTLLSISALRQRNIPIHALLFMGETNPSSRDIIVSMSQDYITTFVDIPQLSEVSATTIAEQARFFSITN